jgi:O-antigen ligase
MDVSRLSGLGKVGGVPGIAIGAVVLVIGAVLALTDTLPEAWRGPLLVLTVLGALGLGALALVGWTRGREQVARADGPGSEARNKDSSKTGGRQEAIATGKGGKAVNERS